MRIVAGTYEGFCYGLESNVEPAVGAAAGLPTTATTKRTLQASQPSAPAASPASLSLVFGYNVHVGCMKSVAMTTSGTRAGQLLVTGGVDERVRIYNLKDRSELGELQQHNGTITCMEFYQSTHLLTGSEDHTVCIWRVHDWALLHVLGGHKAAVTSLSIHPSGRMALSVSRDRTLRLWNLLEGRCAYIKRLQGEGELVRWSSAGDSYLVVVGTTVVVYSAATSEAVGECKHDVRVNSACFSGSAGGGVVATCADDKTIRFFRTDGAALLGKLDVSDVCPTGRIRDMCYVEVSNGGGGGDGGGSEGSLVTVTSAGGVQVWGVPALEGVGTEGEGAELAMPLLATHSLKGEPRLTCVSACLSEEKSEPASAGKTKNSKKRKQRQKQKQQQQQTEEEEDAGDEGEGDRREEGISDGITGDGMSKSSKKKKKKSKKSKRKKAREAQLQSPVGDGVGAGGGGRKGAGAGKEGAKRHRKA